MLDTAALSPFLQSIIQNAKSNGKLWVLVVALAIILRRRAVANKPKLVNDLSHVGRAEGQSNSFKDEFDVIIIGGGTAGCVLASRLSEDPSIRVLVLESGGSGISIIETRIPFGYPRIMGTEHCWNDRTVPQVHSGGNDKYWPQGRMLGGSSSMNAMVFHYGCPEDYDEWARMNSDPGSELWAHKNFNKYFLKFEKYAASTKFPLVDLALRGASGLVDVGFFGNFAPSSAGFIKACTNAGIPQVHDFNTPAGSIGVSKSMTYINSKGRRVSAESAYLTPDVLSRPNLKVATHAQVTRIIFDQTGDVTRAVGVEFARTENGPRFVARARKEVIVSAGALRSPQILMLSGVGPADHLSAHSIPLVHELAGVGAHLMDHPVVDITYRDKTKTGLLIPQTSFKDTIRQHLATLQWVLFGTGMLSTNVLEACAFVRSTDPKLFPATETSPTPEDTTSGPGAPDTEIFFCPFAYKTYGNLPNPVGYGLSLHHVLLRPTSLGTITLKSKNPFDKPIIDPQYCSTQHDVDVLVRGLKLSLRIAQTTPLAESIDETEEDKFFDHPLHKLSDSELAQVVRERAETLYHPSCTARMAPLSEGGVVDPYLRVHGIPNLRVVDASIFPTIVAGHTAGPVFAIAEQAADMIKDAIGQGKR